MKMLPLRLLTALAILTLTQCTWPEPRYDARYEGPATPRPYYRDPILGDSFFGYAGLRCVAASPLWARLHNVQTSDNFPNTADWNQPLPKQSGENMADETSK